MNKLLNFLNETYTAYHAVDNLEKLLKEGGFSKLTEQDKWNVVNGGKYYVKRNQSSIIAFKVNLKSELYFKFVCLHTDSPCLKLKENSEIRSGAYVTLNTETYGSGIWYSFFDRPLKIAGRAVVNENGALISKTVTSDFNVCIPSLAIHMNRGVNDGFAVNSQIDLLPLASLGDVDIVKEVCGANAVSYDLYAVSDSPAFTFGAKNEFICAPRIDNLTSTLASFTSLIESDGDGITLACAFDNEEVGNFTLQGAGSDFLLNTVNRIGKCLNSTEDDLRRAFTKSFMISLDNAQATHPNHPEKSDITNKAVMNGGVVIKNHARKAYCTDARSSAFIKTLFDKNGVKHQTFFNRSDLRSGSTLSAVTSTQLSVLSADLGIAQLAMHSAAECMALDDYTNLLKGLNAYYECSFDLTESGIFFKD